MVRPVPVIVQLGKLLASHLENDQLSQATELLLGVVDDSYNKGFQAGVQHEARRRAIEEGPEDIDDLEVAPIMS